tara:strand:+ start:606 stop:791 length:186 start_codon:yes stop_codon:yes gene_type:complete
MKGYRIEKKEKRWIIVEIATELVVGSFPKKSEAQSLARHLNLGGAFGGRTPKFFVDQNDQG